MIAAITAAEREAVNRPIEHAHGLPNRFYTDAAAARTEREAVLAPTWVCLGFGSELDSGHARPIDLAGLPLMMVKDRDGEVRVFHNVCRHRGHRLVSEPCKLAGAIRCPYHSWTYGLDGRLRAPPHIGGHGVHEAEGFDRSARGLVAVRTAVWLDMIFVNLSGHAAPFEEFIAPLVARWEAFVGPGGLDALRPAAHDGRMDLELGCNWKLAVENYCESYHLPWVHPGLNSYSKIEDHYNIVAGEWGAGQGSYVFEFSERAGIALPRFPRLARGEDEDRRVHRALPNLLLGLQNDHLFALVLKPLAPERTLETLQLYYVGDEGVGDGHALARTRCSRAGARCSWRTWASARACRPAAPRRCSTAAPSHRSSTSRPITSTAGSRTDSRRPRSRDRTGAPGRRATRAPANSGCRRRWRGSGSRCA